MRIIIVTGKGGVGKTNIAANLAYLLAGMKKKTLILDADCGLANIDLIPKHAFWFVGLPLKFKGATGSPIRAVAITTAD